MFGSQTDHQTYQAMEFSQAKVFRQYLRDFPHPPALVINDESANFFGASLDVVRRQVRCFLSFLGNVTLRRH